MDPATLSIGKKIVEGKTKVVYDLENERDEVLIVSKDRITAGDGAKANDLEGKAAVSTQTNAIIFQLLNDFGVKTAFKRSHTNESFVARKCEMLPIEWVTRRYATGSFVKRHPHVSERTKFAPLKLETFLKDDRNHDPFWSPETLRGARLRALDGRFELDAARIEIISQTTVCVFELLERLWSSRNCSLIDMKIEFGVSRENEILLADVIDSDSWRLWPQNDKSQQVDKQVYRDLETVTDHDLRTIMKNFAWVHRNLCELNEWIRGPCLDDHLVVIVMGSLADRKFCDEIRTHCHRFDLRTEFRLVSAHKQTEDTLQTIRHYESLNKKIVFIAVAGRSNGLGLVLAGNCDFPVINCPPILSTAASSSSSSSSLPLDIWSSLNVPSKLGCPTTIYPETAALHAAQIIATSNVRVWAKLRVQRLNLWIASRTASLQIEQENAVNNSVS